MAKIIQDYYRISIMIYLVYSFLNFEFSIECKIIGNFLPDMSWSILLIFVMQDHSKIACDLPQLDDCGEHIDMLELYKKCWENSF